MKTIMTILGCAAAMACVSAEAQKLNIDFGRQSAAPSAAFGGAANQVGTWDQISQLGTTAQLQDVHGLGTNVSLALQADNIDGFFPASSSDVGLLTGDNFFSGQDSSWSVVLTGLHNGFVDLYFYANVNPLVPTGSFTANGVSVTSFGPASGSTLIDGVDYEELQGVAITDGTLQIESTAIFGDGGLSGLQVVSSVPEPEMAAMMDIGLVALGVGLLRRRRRA